MVVHEDPLDLSHSGGDRLPLYAPSRRRSYRATTGPTGLDGVTVLDCVAEVWPSELVAAWYLEPVGN